MSIKSTKSSGFTLVELSIMLTIIAVIAGTVMLEMVTGAVVNSEKATLVRMQAIEQALLNYYKVFNRIPCPAPMNANLNSANFGNAVPDTFVLSGLSNCGTATAGGFLVAPSQQKVVMGSVPTKTLGLSDEFALDGWGRRIAYFMHYDYNVDQTHNTPTTFDLFTTIPVYDHHNSGTRKLVGQYPVMLVSYGKSGNGAVPANGAAALTNRIKALTANAFEDSNITIAAGSTLYPVKKAFMPDAKVTTDRFDQIVKPVQLHQ